MIRLTVLLLCLLTAASGQLSDLSFVKVEEDKGMKLDGFYKLVDKKGRTKLEYVAHFEPYTEGSYLVMVDNSAPGEEIITYAYEEIYDEWGEWTESGEAVDSTRIVNLERLAFYIVDKKYRITRLNYKLISGGHNKHLIAVGDGENGKVHLLDEEQKVVATYEQLQRISGGYMYRTNDTYGFLNKDGSVKTPPIYTWVENWDPKALNKPAGDDFGWGDDYDDFEGGDWDGEQIYAALKDSEPYILVMDEKGEKGVLSSATLELVIPVEYKSFSANELMLDKFLGKKTDGLYLFDIEDFSLSELLPFSAISKTIKVKDVNYLVVLMGEEGFQVVDPTTMESLLPDVAKNVRKSSRVLWVTNQDGNKGIFDPATKRWVLEPEWKRSRHLWDTDMILLSKEDESSLYNLETNQFHLKGYKTIEEYPEFEELRLVTDMNNKMGAVDTNFQLVIPCTYDKLSVLDMNTAKYTQGQVSGYLDVKTGNKTVIKKITDIFPLKWRTKIGLTTYRHNILYQNGKIYIGSNGKEYDLTEDELDGLYILNASTGQEMLKIKPELEEELDSDINGVAIWQDKLFFGSDHLALHCYKTDGTLLWTYRAPGDIEGCPALADLNGDGKIDVVVTVEDMGVVAVDGETGKEIWNHLSDSYLGQGLLNSPALYDLNGDGTKEVLTGSAGRIKKNSEGEYWIEEYDEAPHIWALNGKDGAPLWQIAVPTRQNASILVAEVNGAPYIFSPERHGHIRVLAGNGQIQRMIKTPSGVYSSPVLSSKLNKVFVGLSSQQGNTVGIYQTDAYAMQYTINEYGLPEIPQGPVKAVGRTSATPAIADVLGRYNYQVLIPTELGELIIMDELGNEIGTYAMPSGAEASITVADVDADGVLELLIAGLDGYLYCYDTYGAAARVHWGQFRGDPTNSGVIKASW